jgi:hypothetical protein
MELLHLLTPLAEEMPGTQLAKYYCNLAYADTINPCTNTKYPGSMVASVMRSDVFLFDSVVPLRHVPYKHAEISAWLTPPAQQRIIPPLRLMQRTTNQKFSRLNALQMDFGPRTGGLFIADPPARRS